MTQFGRQAEGKDIAAEVVENLLGNLDGTITRAEAHGLGAAFGLSAVIAGGVSLTLWLTGTDLPTALRAGRYIVLSVGVACIVRLMADVLRVGSLASSFLDGLFQLKEQREEARPVPAGPTISISVENESGKSVSFLNYEGEEGQRAVEFARAYLENRTSEAISYPEAEKHYVGRGLVWSRGGTSSAGYPGWQDFRARMIASKLAFEEGNRWRITERGKRALHELVEVADAEGL
jgi:hypothetical protein